MLSRAIVAFAVVVPVAFALPAGGYFARVLCSLGLGLGAAAMSRALPRSADTALVSLIGPSWLLGIGLRLVQIWL
jgi:hypothetical protein